MGLFACSSQKENDDDYIEKKHVIEKPKKLSLKIYICGELPQKDIIIETLFKDKITNQNYIDRGTHEFLTEQFYWIARTYDELSEQTIQSICNEIKNDRDNNKNTIEQNVILYFGTKNIKSLIEEIKKLGSIYSPFFIILSNEEINKKDIKYSDFRKITNIVINDKTQDKLSSIIISQLWEYDCYYNEKGNIICRYSPDNIFKTLETNLTFYSINILLIGKSRSGKSTFINFLSNKLQALESCKKASVSQKITEYYLHKGNNSSEYSLIKLLDSPGIIASEGKLDEFKKFFNNIENQVHFILFFFMEHDSLEGIDEVFRILNTCNKPVLFVINKATSTEDEDEKSEDISSTISFLKGKNFNNLIDKNNYFGVNIVNGKNVKAFGVEDIFKRIHTIFTEKNRYDKNLENKIKILLKQYENIYEKPLEQQTKYEDMKKFENNSKLFKNELNQQLVMFKYLDTETILKRGKESVKKCLTIINSLCKISEVFKNIDNSIPAISYFQAFMVKEIGEIYGFNINEINIEFNSYLREIRDNAKNMELLYYQKYKNSNNIEKIKLRSDIIEKQLKSELEKSNKEIIESLAEIFYKIRKNEIDEGNFSNNNGNFSNNNIDKVLSIEICKECNNYLINVLKNSNALIFWNNLIAICKKVEENLLYFSKLDSEKNWGKKEMRIINE